MKKKNEQFEKNISRLIKLTNDTNSPSENFIDNLTNDALTQLSRPQSTGVNKMKPLYKRILKIAAVFAFVAIIAAAVMRPSLSKMQYSKKVYQYENSKQIAHPGQPQITKVEKENIAGKPPQIASEMKAKEEKLAYVMRGRSDADLSVSKDRRMGVALNEKPAGLAGRLYYDEVQSAYSPAHGGTMPPNGEKVDAMFFKNYGVNPFVDTEDDHLSTFGMDVDNASYTLCRSYLNNGTLPPNDAVRVEEFANNFKYDYKPPRKETFALYTEIAPWSFGQERKNSYLMSVGLIAKKIAPEDRKPAILTFVIDVSGSMGREDRLELVKRSLRMLVNNLNDDDKIGIAVYGSRGEKILSHTGLDEKDEIISAIDSLHPNGSTNAEEGIRIGYEMARKAYKQGHINRVILCSDGVANVGNTGPDEILKMIKEESRKGITLSVIGFGMGNYNDVLMEQLGDKGDGHYAYVDTFEEAKRIFDADLTSTLQIVAMDAKIQVDFNPEVVRSYRLIGYENRDVPDEKFRDNKQDGGEVGAAQNVTALYELKLWPDKTGRIANVFVRYKNVDTDEVEEFKKAITTDKIEGDIESASANFKLAAASAQFAEILRNSYWARDAKLSDTLELAKQVRSERQDDENVSELVDLIKKADRLMQSQKQTNDSENENDSED
ncbi:MAG: von Willebrand factor type A domain-containing protein [Planctomycetaceae bacterium]|nr:von Willebrand factor type A domain-containing protein [Planctomycetaceae bacterium]